MKFLPNFNNLTEMVDSCKSHQLSGCEYTVIFGEDEDGRYVVLADNDWGSRKLRIKDSSIIREVLTTLKKNLCISRVLTNITLIVNVISNILGNDPNEILERTFQKSLDTFIWNIKYGKNQ